MFNQMILKLKPLAGFVRDARGAALGAVVLGLAFLACGGGSSSESNEAPSITSQPVGMSVRSTQTATFSVGAKGKPDPTYLWQKNGVDIPGAVSATLTLPSTNLLDAGSYKVAVKNSLGTVVSTAVNLVVQPTLLFNAPAGMAAGVAGTIYLANSGDHTICTIQPNGDVAVLAGASGEPGHLDATGTGARFRWPTGLAIDGAGSLYVADGNNTIRVVSPAGVVTTLAGSPDLPGSVDGTGSAARFGGLLQGLTWDGSGNLLVADTYNHTIRRITPAGVVTTVAGLAGQPGATNGALAIATFSNPSGIAVNAAGTIFVSDYGNDAIRAITSGVVSTFAGIAGTTGSADGAATSATFNRPHSILVDSLGRLFISDALSNTLRKVETNGTVTTFAGQAGSLGNIDGTGTGAKFNRPTSLLLLPGDGLLVSDTTNGQIRQVSASAVVTALIKTGP